MSSLLAITIPFAAVDSAQAQCTCRTSRHRAVHRRSHINRYGSTYANRYASSRYYVAERRPNVYQRHRRLFNTLFGAGAGALVGGLIGGRRGAGYGVLAGAGGSQILTHYQRPTNYARYRR